MQYLLFSIKQKLILYKSTLYLFLNSEYDQEIAQSQNRRQPHGTARKSRSTIMRHQEDKLSKATSSLPHQDDCKTRIDIK